MLRSMPQFPTLDAWQQMDESEQDALIQRIEVVQRRKALGMRALVGLGCVVLGYVLYLALT